MRIIIINEYKFKGGTEQSVRKMTEILKEHGDEVFNIYMVETVTSENEICLSVKTTMRNKLFFNKDIFLKLEKIISDLKPDCVILNNAFASPLSVFPALKDVKTCQIIRDYTPLCPKSTCVRDDGNICSGLHSENCMRHCTYHGSKIQLLIKLLLTKKINIERRKNVDKLIAPSECLTKYLCNIGEDCIAMPNPVEIEDYVYSKEKKTLHKYVYIGNISLNKGIKELLDAFSIFSKKRNVELHLYGSMIEQISEITNSLEKDKIYYHGCVAHDEIKQILQSGYALVVPSKWMENYPTTVIEGMSNRILVIGSNRGGIPEQIGDNRGIIFEFGVKGLVEALNRSEELSTVEYNKVVDNAYLYVKENNSYDKYYERLMKFLKKDLIG